MELLETQTIALALYKITCLISGILLAYMGYRLFMAGVWGNAGHIESEFKDNKIIIKKAAPGTFFVLAGVIVIGATVNKGMNYDFEKKEGTYQVQDQDPDKPVLVD